MEYCVRLSQATFSGVNYYAGMTPKRLFRTAEQIHRALEKK